MQVDHDGAGITKGTNDGKARKQRIIASNEFNRLVHLQLRPRFVWEEFVVTVGARRPGRFNHYYAMKHAIVPTLRPTAPNDRKYD